MTDTVINWLRKNTFKAHLVAFLLMIPPAAGLYFAAEGGSTSLMWLLLGLVITGNILAILVR
jgi:hypothetical protein